MERRRLLEAFGGETPRYTSFPPANRFADSIDPATHRADLADLDTRRQVGIYVHVPFCDRRCDYCGCFVVPTRNQSIRETYLEALCREIGIVGDHLGSRRRCEFVHLGGGTPSSLAPEQFRRLVSSLRETFDVDDPQEFSIEIDPRVTTQEHVDAMIDCGVDRVSLGVQDKSPEVQRAIGREQTWEETLRTYESFRQAGIESINVDLVYGLPEQTVDRFAATLDGVVALEPQRICVFGYAHLPSRMRNQRTIDEATLPDAKKRWDLLIETHRVLEAFGYVHIGLDHFVRPNDSLAEAQSSRTLGRGFMGYTQFRGASLLGLGVSAISEFPLSYAQNAKKLAEYFRRTARGELPVSRGIRLTSDDFVRRFVIQEILCNLSVDLEEFESRFGMTLKKMFPVELTLLVPFLDAGLVRVFDDEICVTDEGRWFLRAIAAVFDSGLARMPTLRGVHSSSI